MVREQPSSGSEPDLAAMYAAFPRKRVAAGALFLDADDRVLLVEPTYKAYWDIPGGVVEADESPRAGCRREVREELSLDRPVGAVLCIDWLPAKPPRTESLVLVFDGGLVGDGEAATITLDDGELSAWRFVERDRCDELLGERDTRRVAAALAARRTSTTVYLEDSLP